VFGYAAYQISVNYAFTLVYALDGKFHFGYAEILIELGLGFGALVPTLRPQLIPRISNCLILVFSLISAGTGVWSTFTDNAWVALILQTVNLTAFSVLYAAGSAVIALQLSEARYSVVYTIITFLALVVASVINLTGSLLNFSTGAYLQVAAALSVIFVPLLPVFYFCNTSGEVKPPVGGARSCIETSTGSSLDGGLQERGIEERSPPPVGARNTYRHQWQLPTRNYVT